VPPTLFVDQDAPSNKYFPVFIKLLGDTPTVKSFEFVVLLAALLKTVAAALNAVIASVLARHAVVAVSNS